ncbi:MAG TPA: DNA circularization N-terminal domain-containing protein [Myxococcota bacterium]|nr:DNA circularization N-terminal domain-containing protein [Myxococcota bacterium]
MIPMPASFGGASFTIVQVTNTHGRRWAKHEYPGLTGLEVEDMGKMPFQCDVVAVFWGATWATDLAALRAVVESGDVATFVHPYNGIFSGIVENFQTTQDDRLGHAAVNFSFVEAAEVGAYTAAATLASATAAVGLAAAELASAVAAL